MDFITNGIGNGQVAQTLLENNCDAGILRPWIGTDGNHYCQVTNADGSRRVVRMNNAAATLRKEDWLQIDTAIVKAARDRLRLVSDLVSGGLTYRTNGMGTSILQTETMSDVRGAAVDMDGLSDSPDDRPEFDLNSLPLPIIHKDFSFSLRNIQSSRQGGSPLDLTMAEQCSRQVAETAEKLALGLMGTNFGGAKLYGLTNFPDRLTQTFTSPEATGWTPAVFYNEVEAMVEKARVAKHYGPFRLYVSSAWARFLDRDWSTAKGDMTLRERVLKIEKISGITELDYLTGYQTVLVQMTSDVIREVIGMDLQTLQWPSSGGLKINYKVMAIMVPQVRSDFNKNCGIVHGNV